MSGCELQVKRQMEIEGLLAKANQLLAAGARKKRRTTIVNFRRSTPISALTMWPLKSLPSI